MISREHHLAITRQAKLLGLRLWRSVKFQEVYLPAYEMVSDVRAGLTRYFEFFNQRRPHRGLRSRRRSCATV